MTYPSIDPTTLENLLEQVSHDGFGALLRLVTAILVEISEEWEDGRAYLDMTQS